MEIVSEKKLAVSSGSTINIQYSVESTIRDYFKILTKKVSEYEITQEFVANILVLTKIYV